VEKPWEKNPAKQKHNSFSRCPPHPRTVLFEVAFFWGDAQKIRRVGIVLGQAFPSPTASGKVYHTVDGSEILHLLRLVVYPVYL